MKWAFGTIDYVIPNLYNVEREVNNCWKIIIRLRDEVHFWNELLRYKDLYNVKSEVNNGWN